MRILLTGANGYIGMRLLPVLLEKGHDVICMVRNPDRLSVQDSVRQKITIIQADLLDAESLKNIPSEIDVAFYLVHSMGGNRDFIEKEKKAAQQFVDYIETTRAQQIIYLSGIIPKNKHLSKHLQSRYYVENILYSSTVACTTLRAGIIVGSGSASFEIIRDIVEKLPVMVAPKWLNTKCSPIAIRDVITYLEGAICNTDLYNKQFDISGSDTLSYKEMLLQYAAVRGYNRFIWILPVLTPRLSSYWLYFVTSTNFSLARNLVESMKVDVVAAESEIKQLISTEQIEYKRAVQLAFKKIDQHMVVSSWKDSLTTSTHRKSLTEYIQVPEHGVFTDLKYRDTNLSKENVLQSIWSIGGTNGWYYGNFLWKIRGYLDKLVGGIGLRRGRTHEHKLNPGDALDFWRVLLADQDQGRLLLFAEMKLPGEAWLEFRVSDQGNTRKVTQKATFRPRGVLGRLYWYSVLPFHYFVFNGMINNILKKG